MRVPREQGIPVGALQGCPRDAWAAVLGLMGVCTVPVEEENPSFWYKQAAAAIDASLKLQPRIREAKNLIIFLGDGESSWHPSKQADMARTLLCRMCAGHLVQRVTRTLSLPRIWGAQHHSHPHP